MIPQIYWINLERSLDRKNSMHEQFFRENEDPINNLRVDAVDGSCCDLQELVINKISEISAKKNEIACTLSHLKAIKLAFDKGLEEVIIMEDDAKFEKKDLEKIKKTISEVDVPDLEILQLTWIIGDYLYIVEKIFQAKLDEKKIIPFEMGFYSSAAYYINRKGMQSVLEKHFNTASNKFDLKGCALGDFVQADYVIMGINKNVYTIVVPLVTYSSIMPSLIHLENEALHNYSLQLIEKLKIHEKKL